MTRTELPIPVWMPCSFGILNHNLVIRLLIVGLVEVIRVRPNLHLHSFASRLSCRSRNGLRCCAESVSVAVEEDALAFTLGTNAGLNPLAPASALPDGLEETERTTLRIRSVVLSHHLFNSFGSLIGIVERNNRHVVMKNMGLDDAMEEGTTDETKLPINRCSGATSVCPGMRIVMRKSRIGVLEICDCDCRLSV